MSEVAAVTGGRHYGEYLYGMDAREEYFTLLLQKRLAGALNAFSPSVVLVGDCPTGADARARAWAYGRDILPRVFYADWKKYGKSAGPRRNREMLDAKPDYLLSFHGGRGTHDCTMEAIRRGIPVFFPDNIHFEGIK